jgi:hypothetical protein
MTHLRADVSKAASCLAQRRMCMALVYLLSTARLVNTKYPIMAMVAKLCSQVERATRKSDITIPP